MIYSGRVIESRRPALVCFYRAFSKVISRYSFVRRSTFGDILQRPWDGEAIVTTDVCSHDRGIICSA